MEALLQQPSASEHSLVPALRANLNAKLERLLQRPVIAAIGGLPRADHPPDHDLGLPDAFRVLQSVADLAAPASDRRVTFREDKDGSYRVAVCLDYDDVWREAAKEILDQVASTVENHVTYLTDEQRQLLERSPREFLALQPGPETAELLGFEKQVVGGVERVVELIVAAPPEGPAHVRHIAIVPNLIPLERQLAALKRLEDATDDSGIAPLRVLVGLADASVLSTSRVIADDPAGYENLDEYQAACVRKARLTPHFAVIKGPPGSGKTTVITNLIRRALAAGERVLVVSPTHVAVDNVVDKLTKLDGADDLEPRSVPVRYSAKSKKLLDVAQRYWIGPKKERRAGTIAQRVERRLRATLPLAERLFEQVDDNVVGYAPISAAVAAAQGVICGTPIGILSYDPVKNATPGAFDLLIVDEVSKMTLPEFLAVAVKARRWVLVGDPEQLPPFNNAEENATTLDDIVSPLVDLACSVGGLLERVRPELRQQQRYVVASSDPEQAAIAIRAHLQAIDLDGAPDVSVLGDPHEARIVVCGPDEVSAAATATSSLRRRDRTHNPGQEGTTWVLVERGLQVARPTFASGLRFVDPRLRAQALVFDNAFNIYHTLPWAKRSGQKLRVSGFRNGLEKYLPSTAALGAVGVPSPMRVEARAQMVEAIAARYALNTVSVYDWLTGLPTEHFDVSPLKELAAVAEPLAGLRNAVAPYVGTLRKQYRMHASLSRLPRDLFYFGEALDDGKPGGGGPSRVALTQVHRQDADGESNTAEGAKILEMLGALNARTNGKAPKILVITPYLEQERHLRRVIDAERRRGALDRVDVEVCTLDRCQGRESEYVFISLVRNRASIFMDAPKRWNVALTRAMEGLFIVGDIDAYLREAADARRKARTRGPFDDGRPMMSLLARILETYQAQINNSTRGAR